MLCFKNLPHILELRVSRVPRVSRVSREECFIAFDTPDTPDTPDTFMRSYLFLPVSFLKFWYLESPREIVAFFGSLNKAFFQLFSLPLFIRTFFKPLKNEYRPGLVGFSRGMGMFIKSVFILVDIIMLVLLLFIEVGLLLLFLAFPIMTIVMLFYD